jgi:hypothetical protein
MSETSFLVEQAVFSVNLTRRLSNGRNEATLLDATEQASREDLDAAREWAARVETLETGLDSFNLFFLPTPSGAFAIGRLTPASTSERGAFYFQIFFVEREAFFQCGANPIALLHLALNTARFALYRPGAKLEPFSLEARAPWINHAELRRTTERLGTRALATLIQTTLEEKRTAFVADCSVFSVVAALFDLTPIHWRPTLSFAVGLRFGGGLTFRLNGATAKRGVEGPSVEDGATRCDLRDVVENDDAYPIDNPWAALVATALQEGRLDYVYERMAEDFFLRLERPEDDCDASSDEVAELGLRWRAGLENAIRGDEEEETDDFEEGGDKTTDDETETSFDGEFDGEFEGGWRDSDGDESWLNDEAGASEKKLTDDRVAPEFTFKIVESNDEETDETEEDREKGREEDASQKKNDNKGKEGGERFEVLFDVFADKSFEEEWAALLKRNDEKSDAADVGTKENEEKATSETNGDRAGGDKREETENKGADATNPEAADKRKEIFNKLYDAAKRAFGATGDDAKCLVLAGTCDDVCARLEDEEQKRATGALDALTDLKTFLGERGEIAMERLENEARGDDEKARRTDERETRRLRLAPFATLSAALPGWNEELRRFDALFDAACSGTEATKTELLDFWRRWRRELDDETVARIRGAYEERLRGRMTASDRGAVERMNRILTAWTIYDALFLER